MRTIIVMSGLLSRCFPRASQPAEKQEIPVERDRLYAGLAQAILYTNLPDDQREEFSAFVIEKTKDMNHGVSRETIREILEKLASYTAPKDDVAFMLRSTTYNLTQRMALIPHGQDGNKDRAIAAFRSGQRWCRTEPSVEESLEHRHAG